MMTEMRTIFITIPHLADESSGAELELEEGGASALKDHLGRPFGVDGEDLRSRVRSKNGVFHFEPLSRWVPSESVVKGDLPLGPLVCGEVTR